MKDNIKQVVKDVKFLIASKELDATVEARILNFIEERDKSINNRHTSELNCGWYGEIEKLCNCKEPDDSGWYGDARSCKCGGLYIE